MQGDRKLIAAKGKAKSDQDLKRIVVNPLHHLKDEPAEDNAQNCTAQRLLQEKPDRAAKPFGMVPVCWESEADKDQVDHIADAIIEKALTSDLGLERLLQFSLAQDAHHRHRIGGRDQRAENKGDEQGHSGDPAEAHADNRCRKAHAEGRHQKDDNRLLPQRGEAHMKRASEKEESQHPFKQRLGKRDLSHRPAERVGKAKAGNNQVEQHRANRCCERHDQNTNAWRQTQPEIVDRAKDTGQHDQKGCCL